VAGVTKGKSIFVTCQNLKKIAKKVDKSKKNVDTSE
jgi:hypothetical protein